MVNVNTHNHLLRDHHFSFNDSAPEPCYWSSSHPFTLTESAPTKTPRQWQWGSLAFCRTKPMVCSSMATMLPVKFPCPRRSTCGLVTLTVHHVSRGREGTGCIRTQWALLRIPNLDLLTHWRRRKEKQFAYFALPRLEHQRHESIPFLFKIIPQISDSVEHYMSQKKAAPELQGQQAAF